MRYALLISSALLGAACSDQGFTVLPDVWEVDMGSIEGRTCDPDTSTWLEGAMVYSHIYDNSGNLYDTRITYSDADGRWTLEDMPVDRSYFIYIQVGTALVDSAQIPIKNAEPNVALPEPECNEVIDTTVAVITGDYNDFEETFSAIGVTQYDEVNGVTGSEMIDFLSDVANLQAYEVVFFDSGHVEEDVVYDTDGSDVFGDVDRYLMNVNAYVEGGGVVFANDWSYDLVERIWPDKIEFLGDDSVPDDAQQGEPGEVNAAVVDSDLSVHLGASSARINYDLAVWPPIESVSPDVEIHLSGDVMYRQGDDTFFMDKSPLLVSFEVGAGLVIFSTYRHASTSTDATLETLQYMLEGL